MGRSARGLLGGPCEPEALSAEVGYSTRRARRDLFVAGYDPYQPRSEANRILEHAPLQVDHPLVAALKLGRSP